MPQLVQLFETTIISSDHSFALRTITVPVGSLKDEKMLDHSDLLNRLELEEGERLDSPSRLPDFLAAATFQDTSGESVSIDRVATLIRTLEPEVGRLCDEAAFSPMIPFQESPLDLQSLADLATKATGVTIGAYAGFVASGGTPLVLITVPLGMVLVGAAAGLGRALEEGLRKRILSLMGESEQGQDHSAVKAVQARPSQKAKSQSA